MAKNLLESLIRELQKTIVTLVNKVDSLETRITEQSGIINKLNSASDINNERKSSATAPCTASLATAVVPQRPVRTARAQASLALAELAKPAKKRSDGNVRAANTPKTDGRPNDLVAISSDKKPAPAMEKTAICSKYSTTPTRTSSSADEENCGLQWQVVSRTNKKKTPRPVTVGTAISSSDLQAAERFKYIQAWSFRPETTTTQVLSFLNSIVGSTKYSVEKRSIRSETHAAFVIGMPEGVYDAVTRPTAWPAKVCFTDWFPARPRQQRGAQRAGSGSSVSA